MSRRGLPRFEYRVDVFGVCGQLSRSNPIYTLRDARKALRAARESRATGEVVRLARAEWSECGFMPTHWSDDAVTFRRLGDDS